MNWESKLQNWCDIVGASHAGATALTTPLTWPHYEEWLQLGFHGKMDYLKQHAGFKKDPQSWIPEAQSAFVFAFPYIPHPEPLPVFSHARTALYSQGQDYHHWVKDRLQKVTNLLQAEYPEHLFFIHTDSSPILERDLAQKAGLGWFGKNTCLIHPQNGSFFLIGEIITSLKVDTVNSPIHDFCGTCTRCLDVCPTKALKAPRVLQADLCISYLTIESREVPPAELRPLIGDWLFGCDLCQTVCPWNQKAFKNANLAVDSQLLLSNESRKSLILELKTLLTDSHNQIQKRLLGTALARAGAKGLKRNALVVIGNQKLEELRPEVEALLKVDYFSELAQWTLNQFTKN